eukprot:scaffold2936_cov113-Cylindrotheca_fusiformis.AAC.4
MGDEKDQEKGGEAALTTDMSDKKYTLCGVPRNMFFCLILSHLLAIAIGAGVTAGVLQSKDDDCDITTSVSSSIPTETPSSTPASTPSSTPTAGELSDTELLATVVLPGVDIADLEETSPQYRSLEWLANDDSRNLNIEDDATELIERFSLVTLYFATEGEDWESQSLWLSDSSHCDWYAVDCDTNGRVTTLNPTDNFLSGMLPPEIGNLRNAVYIGLGSNSIVGSIPTEIGLLTSATYLNLYQNSIMGTLPTEIGNLNRLVRLDVGDNQLEGTIPSEIENLQQLTALYLFDNTFSGTIPSEIGNLQQLTVLDLPKNSFSGNIPSEIGNLQQLVRLYLHDNTDLTGIVPVEVGQLESILAAYFFNTSLTGGLDDLAFCKNRDLSNFNLLADCKGFNPKITCECCTECCDMDGDNCVSV